MEVMAIQSRAQRQRMLIIYSCCTLAVMILEIIFRDNLFSLSRDIITSLQSTFPGETFQIFFRFISLFGTPSLLVPLFLIIFASEIKKFLAIKLVLYICFVGYVVSVIKAIYANPRPYWVYPYMTELPGYTEPGIHPYEHYAEYGNPSGHSFLVTSFYGYLYYVFLYKDPKKTPGIGAEEDAFSSQRRTSHFIAFPKDEELQEKQNLQQDEEKKNEHHSSIDIKLPEQHLKEEVHENPLYPISKGLYFTIMLLICISRMYLGMHGLNQVLLGLTLGSYSLFIIIYYVDPELDIFLKKVRSKSMHNRGVLFAQLGIAYVILTIIPILLFLRNESNPGKAWEDWWEVVKTEVNPSKLTFAYNKCFLDCGVLGVGFGAALAMMETENNYLEKGLKFGAITKVALVFRIIIFMLTAGIIGAIFVLIPIPEDNLILIYLINSNFAATAATYAAISLAPRAYAWCGLEADKYFHHPREHHIDRTFSI